MAKKKAPARKSTNRPSQVARKNAPSKSRKPQRTGSGRTGSSKNYPQRSKKDNPLIIWVGLAIICIASFIAYLPALEGEFTNWDDNSYAESNSQIKSLSADNLKSMFFGKGKYVMGNYHPLAMFSLAIDYKLHKIDWLNDMGEKIRDDKNKFKPDDAPTDVDPFIFHLRNILFHLANTILVFWLIYLIIKRVLPKYKLPIAMISALFFSLTTMHVESVAWISERKDMIHAFYFFLSLIVYVKYIESNKKGLYILALLFFLLSLLGKAQAVSLSVTLIAIDLLFKRKIQNLGVIVEKIPFFVLSLAFGLLAIDAQASGEAIHDIDEYAFHYRLLFVSFGYVQYYLKMLVPHNFSAIYPYPHLVDGSLPPDFFPYPIWINPIVVVGIIAGFVYAFRRQKLVAFGIAFFTINIFLQLQFIPVGSAIYADRYSYVPSMGFMLVLAFWVIWLFDKYKTKTGEGSLKVILGGLVIIYSIFLGTKTFAQSKMWKDSITLWSNTVEICPTALVAWNNMGSAKDKLERKEEALLDFTRAIELKPDYTHAFYNRGTSKKDLNRHEEAIEDFNKALSFDPNFAEAYHNRGISKEAMGDLEGALKDYNEAIELKPNVANIYSSRGVAKGKSGNLEAAIIDFNKSIEIKPDNPEAFSNRGLANDKLGNFEAAMQDYNHALELNPKFVTAFSNRGIVKRKLNDLEGAIVDYTTAINLDPKFADAYLNRGVAYVDKKMMNEACQDFSAAHQLGSPRAMLHLQQFCRKQQ